MPLGSILTFTSGANAGAQVILSAQYIISGYYIYTFTTFPGYTALAHSPVATDAFIYLTEVAGDTGQLDPVNTTISNPTGFPYVGPGAGNRESNSYELWQFNDALQSSTAPVFLKIQYGSAGNTAGQTGIALTFGNGYAFGNSGTINGNQLLIQAGADGINANGYGEIVMGGNSSSHTSNLYAGSNGSYLSLFLDVTGGNNTAFGFVLSRLVDNNGNALSTGLEIVTLGGYPGGSGDTGIHYHGFVPFNPMTSAILPVPTGNTTATDTGWCAAVPPTGTGAFNSNIGLFPLMPPMGFPGNPTMGSAAFFTADLATSGTSVTLTMYGASHAYVTARTDAGNSTYPPKVNGNGPLGLAFRYE
jgi:hypothetical protein